MKIISKKNRKREMTSLQGLLYCLPFKHKLEIRDELIADLRKAIINNKYLEQSEIEVF